jgi:hypothetical protein
MSLSAIKLPVSLTSIGSSAFRKCVTLQEIIVPSAVREIGGDAFRECSSLTKADLSVSLRSIGGSAFAKCVSLKEVNINTPTVPKISKSTFKGVIQGVCHFYIPRGSKPLFQADKTWSKIALIER